MSSLGLAACGPYKQVINISSSCCLPASRPCFLPIFAIQTTRSCPGLAFNASTYRRSVPVCLFGGKGKPGEDSEGSSWFPWKALEKGWDGLTKRQSMEDILKEQIRKGQFAGEGGGEGIPPGGGYDGFGGSGDESSDGVLDEFIQVILATIGLIFVYIYIIDGEELTRLAGDFIRYLFTRKQSNRLKQTMYMWSRFFQRLTRKEVERDRFWLEREILNTPTWWYNPIQFKKYLRSRLASLSSSSSSSLSSPSSSSYYE